MTEAIEVTTFRLNGRSCAEFVAANADIDAWLRRQPGFLSRRIAERDDEICRQRDLRQATERQLSATRGVVTRIKNRVGHGVCPCCNRSFGNVARHMADQHPNWAAEAAE